MNDQTKIKCIGALLLKAEFWKAHYQQTECVNDVMYVECMAALETASCINMTLPAELQFNDIPEDIYYVKSRSQWPKNKTTI